MILSQFFEIAANILTLALDFLAARAAALEPLQFGAIALKLGLIPAQFSVVSLQLSCSGVASSCRIPV